ncbi:MAG: hypothetical protein DWQ47_04170 [Acidobacteria bacterium]|nr:MAG: hypothetical protein DWQ32_07720 [Acidobacteriota bacterium]REK01590.1 MAG: hypothetical protein DWQ38_04155 [Acidobacteriota bacterium]REK14546.1 MAG: hypothetical protein DWQ43_13410 [Acidobacteriota bacterium]REK45261.1 MAG: hypothetical protein DWQ47_04170 [Acidobacteriota bacterium]
MLKTSEKYIAGFVSILVGAVIALAIRAFGISELLNLDVGAPVLPEHRFGYSHRELVDFMGRLVIEVCDAHQQYISAYYDLQFYSLGISLLVAIGLVFLSLGVADSVEDSESAKWLAFFPASMFVFDALENCFLIQFATYNVESIDRGLVAISSVLTQLKFTSAFVSLAGVVLFFIVGRSRNSLPFEKRL